MSPEKQLEATLTTIFSDQENAVNDDGLGFVHRKVSRFVKKKVKRVAKIVKKVAPYAAAGAAVYFAAPYALSGAKFLGAKAMGLKSMVMGAGALSGGQMGPPAPATSLISPEVLKMGGQLAIQGMRQRGVNVNSPQGQQAVQQYVDQSLYRAERNVTPNKPFNMTNLLIPAVVGVGAVLMLKG